MLWTILCQRNNNVNKWSHTSVKQQIKTKNTEQNSNIRLCLSILWKNLRKVPFVFTPFIIVHNVALASNLASLKKPDSQIKILDILIKNCYNLKKQIPKNYAKNNKKIIL